MRIWLPHPAHFIGGRDCCFHLATVVKQRYLVSTVGEYWPDSMIRQIVAQSRQVQIVGQGDAWNQDYLQKIGYEKIGYNRLYETMVFKAVRDPDHACCPWKMISGGSELAMRGYNDAGEAYRGHLALCRTWEKKNA